MKPLTLLTHGVQLSSPRWSRSPLRWEMEEDKDGEKGKKSRFILGAQLLRACLCCCCSLTLSMILHPHVEHLHHACWFQATKGCRSSSRSLSRLVNGLLPPKAPLLWWSSAGEHAALCCASSFSGC